MPKTSAIGGGLWDGYSNQVKERMKKPHHSGSISEEEAQSLGGKLLVVELGSKACGDDVRLFWVVKKRETDGQDIVALARFESFGCGTAIASSDMMCELCLGKTVDDVLKINNLTVERHLRDSPDKEAFPPQKMHCSVMAQEVLRMAVAKHRGVDMNTLEDREIVCACAQVTVGLVKEVIRLNDLTTVEQITQYTKAGGFCGSCVRPGGHEKKEIYLIDILRQTRADMAKERIAETCKARGVNTQVAAAAAAADAAAAAATPEIGATTPASATASTTETGPVAGQANIEFRKMNVIRKGNAVQAVLDEYILPILEQDGGSCDVVDVRESADGKKCIVSIEYSGECVGCSSADKTLAMMQEILQAKIDSYIEVISVD